MRKEDFKVYSNPNIKKRMQEEVEEVTFELEIPDEDTITALFIASPYFLTLMRAQDMFYYPVDLSAEETLMAPMFSPDVFWDFIENTKLIRMKEKILLGPLLHIAVEDEDGEDTMISLFEGVIQVEFTKFLKTVIMAMNIDAALADEFDEAFEHLMSELEENGYLDQVMMNMAEFMDVPEILAELLFPEDDDDE
jgi:hypothetical protein